MKYEPVTSGRDQSKSHVQDSIDFHIYVSVEDNVLG